MVNTETFLKNHPSSYQIAVFILGEMKSLRDLSSKLKNIQADKEGQYTRFSLVSHPTENRCLQQTELNIWLGHNSKSSIIAATNAK